MGFDLSSAQPVTQPAGFDLSTAQPVATPSSAASFSAPQQQYSPLALPDPNSNYPVTSEVGAMLKNAWPAFGRTWPALGHGIQQLYAQAKDKLTGSNDYPALQADEAERRRIDAPLDADLGGKLGTLAGYSIPALLPGADTALGATAVGAGLGALRSTAPGESRGVNTAIGGGLGFAGNKIGTGVANWVEGRAAQPFMGWNMGSANRAAAAAVGSDAPRLDQPAIAATQQRFNSIFGAARDPNVDVPVGLPTAQRIVNTAAPLNPSSRSAFEGNSQVQDLMTHLQSGTATAQQLGAISTELRQEGQGLVSSKDGDRQLGRALLDLREHVDDLVGQSITDPALSAAYTAARPQYKTFKILTDRPTILNSSTGDVNLRNLGNYLQKYDKAGYTRGANTSPLYEAARYGQASGIGSRPPPPILQPVKWATYHTLNSPVVGLLGGTASRVGQPIAPLLPRGVPLLGFDAADALATNAQ